MPRIQLAHWHDGQAPGTELDVDDDQLRTLVRDGRVAALVEDTPAEPEPDGQAEPPEQAAAEEATPEPAPEAEEPAKSGRRRR